ncbi:hypothetical protein FKM82_013132 [Ascaphus truei]
MLETPLYSVGPFPLIFIVELFCRSFNHSQTWTHKPNVFTPSTKYGFRCFNVLYMQFMWVMLYQSLQAHKLHQVYQI